MIVAALLNASRAVAFAGKCGEAAAARLGFAVELSDAGNRLDQAIWRAQEIWGTLAFREAELRWHDLPPLARRKADIRHALDEAQAALDRAERDFDEATTALSCGAWIGALELCSDTILTFETGFDTLLKQPVACIQLKPCAAASLGELTGQSVGRHLAIRVAGDIVSRPTVLERMVDGRLQITGPRKLALERMGRLLGDARIP